MSQQSHAKATVGVAALLTFSFYVPAYFQYEVTEVIPCKSDIMDSINTTMSEINLTGMANSTCYRAKESCFTTTSAWFTLSNRQDGVILFMTGAAGKEMSVIMTIK